MTKDTGKKYEPFANLAELKTENTRLLGRWRENSEAPEEVLPEVKEFMARGRATGARLGIQQDRWDAQRFIDYWSTIIYRIGEETPKTDLAEFDEAQAPTISDDDCPYLGLDAFRESDNEKFFGRRDLIERMIDKLADEHFLVVIGPSGSGKSSIVRAGILPELKNGALPGSENWNYFAGKNRKSPTGIMVPGATPLKNLAKLLCGGAADDPEKARDLTEKLAADEMALLDFLNSSPDKNPVVLIIDQFEELFTLCISEGEQTTFVNNLLRVIQDEKTEHRIIITMRIDFEAFVARLPEFYSAFSQAQERMTPLSAAELREAIEKPAARVGLEFEQGVVESLLQDILGEPGALPLLQFTLLKLWEKRTYNMVTLESYEELGGGRLALARTADKLYDEMIPEDQILTRRILLRMIRVGNGLEVTSRRVPKESLYIKDDPIEKVDAILERLLKAHLIRLTDGKTPEDTRVEVAHEALVRNWPKFDEWVVEERTALATQRRLEAKALDWIRLGRGESGLLDAGQLAEAEEWLKSGEAIRLGYNNTLPILVDTSREYLDMLAAKEEAAKKREIEQLREFNTQLSSKNRKLKIFVVIMSALFLYAVISVPAGGYLYFDYSDIYNKLKTKNIELEDKDEIITEERKEKNVAISQATNTQQEIDKIVDKNAEDKNRKPAETINLRKKVRPLRPGISIGNLEGVAATLCCLVANKDTGQRFIIGGLPGGTVEITDKVIQPSKADGGLESDQIATITQADEKDPFTFAGLLDGLIFPNEIPEIGKINGIREPKDNEKVTLIGRTSGAVEGLVLDVNYEFGDFKNLLLIEKISHPGDAGGPVLDKNNNLIGILVGKDENGSIVLPIGQIFEKYNLMLVTE